MDCPVCGQKYDGDARFCEGCGADLQARSRVQSTTLNYTDGPQAPTAKLACPSCGQTNDHDSVFCENCGAALSLASTGVAGPPLNYRTTPVVRPPRQSNLDFSAVDSGVYLPLGLSAGGALLLLISLVLPWQQYGFGGPMKFNVGAGYGWLCILSAFGTIALTIGALLSRASGGSFELPFPEGYVFMGLGGFSMFIAFTRMLVRESYHSVGSGSIVAMVASIIIVVSGYLWLRN